MKPAAFGYLAPTSVAEACDLLSRYGEDGKVLAGGQSLVPLLNLRLAEPRYLVDINRCQGLGDVGESGEALTVGALVRQRAAETSEAVRRACPLLAEAVSWVGHIPTRWRGTVCGSIAHADPSGEIPAVLAALGGSVVLRSRAGERVVPAGEFFLGYLTTAMRPDELLVEARFPKLPAGTGVAFLEIARRHGDFAIAGVACAALPDGSFRLGLAGVAPGPVRPVEAEKALAQGAVEDAAELAAAACDPVDDLHASADYRRAMAAVLVRRAAKKAVQARG
jgi:CO/xanthine dehydrogenase FAD-binding subunit